MIPLEVGGVFALASLALALAPGPDNIFVLTQSAMYGRVAGLMVTLGLCTGLLVHTTAVSLGVAALMQASTVAFTVLKTLGAAYLLFLAWQAFRTASDASPVAEQSARGRAHLYARGVVMNVTNPKVAIFFLAFLPQFASSDRGSVVIQLLSLGALFMLVTFLVFGSIAWAAGLIGEWLTRSRRAQIALKRVAGAVFVTLALHLLTSTR